MELSLAAEAQFPRFAEFCHDQRMAELVKRFRSEGLTDEMKTEMCLWLLEWRPVFVPIN
jgi:hypothetical protein